MATLDLSKARFSFSMTNPDLVSFAANDGVGTQNGWSFLTTGGHDVLVEGQGLTFNAAGQPTGGTATSIEIDVGNDDPSNPELVITGVSAAAASLDDGPASFWRFLEGDDVILGPELAKGASGGLSPCSATASRRGTGPPVAGTSSISGTASSRPPAT
jgi:hypothetical protein